MKIERTCIDKKREFPEWLARAIADERAAAADISDPVQRRVAEIEIDQIESRVLNELAGQ